MQQQSPQRIGLNRKEFAPEFLIPMILCHLVVIGIAPFLFSWAALIFAYVTAALFAYSMGIFHHMQLSHNSFQSKTWLTRLGALFGTLTWRGPMAAPIRYVAMHRIHHQHSDKGGDPHSPIDGRLHALISWFWNLSSTFRDYRTYAPFAGRVSDDRILQFLDRNVNLLQALWGALAFGIGSCVPMLWGQGFDAPNGLRFLVYGVFVKTLLVVYLGGAVDLVNHGVGYRNYETTDLSTNSVLMGVFHLGGAISWHNNHHAHPAYFFVRKNKWEFDAHYQFLRLLQWFGAVTHIKTLDEFADEKESTRESPFRNFL